MMIKLKMSNQKYSSANTSINKAKLPALFKKIHFQPGTLNLDYGGGKYDNVTVYLAKKSVKNVTYDKYNRTDAENENAFMIVERNGGADTVTCSNVLNVIREKEERLNVLQNIKASLKQGGRAYITVYSGDKSGVGKQTGKDQFQLNRKIGDYLEEIREVFPNAKRSGIVITAFA